ncbi:hypothetical protein BO70DRAFT_148049 [Aspergillus heteromorphus CBS 117.55]|uniref:Mid2 domain-containing protein n=1 Tax=Aspergillus heteromorphus CBS 117.55 TaxID=1448321 RepID=A0A317V5H5_9EURO|nr:uncharacterized protein BO70DRAFT_148049 [Aspergillus heteromorphus CBS 117.55]PWY69554.1 hypothetical protein BO70DRAFT_148049 [Aspergillus heteromorphus CBS 117.55]
MVVLSVGLSKARRRPSFTLLLLFILVIVAQVSLAQTTTDDSTTVVTTSDSTTESATTSSDDSTTTSAASSSSTDSSATTTTDSQSTSTGSSASSTNDIPIVTVPPTADAPYMQKSKVPEGTVFIAVGAVLGAIGLAILAWRGIVAWSVNRSVRQAALMRSSESKGLLRSRKRRSRSRRSSSGQHGVTLDKLGDSHHHHRRRHSHSHSRHHRSSKTPSTNSALFFSPTAGMQHTSNKRRSSYLPAGYYNAGNAAPPRAQENRFSAPDLPGMGPQSQGYTKARTGPSPPESPGLSPGLDQDTLRRSTRRSHAEASTSTVNLSSPPQGRTPSAYLEDLFDSHPPQDSH